MKRRPPPPLACQALPIVLAGLALVCSAVGALEFQPRRPVLALVGGRVIASPEALPVEAATIVIENGRIAAVGTRRDVTIAPGATTIDCRNLVLVAGFQNSHVHFTEEHWRDAATQPAAKLATQLQSMLTRYGFVAAVDTGSSLSNTVALRQRIVSGEVPGPRILTAGSPLYPPAGVPYYLKDGSVPADVLRTLPQPSTREEARSAVAENLAGGADIVKLFTGSWVTSQRVLAMPEGIATAAVQEAHRRRRLVYAHTSSPEALEVTLSAGVDVIAHALDETRGLTPEHLRRMHRRGIALVPTLTLFAEARNASEIFRQVHDYAALGGDILFGTDVGYHRRYNPEVEYDSLRRAGLSWQQILASLTTNPARQFGASATRGRLVRGMSADVVVLGSDPRSSVQAFTDVRYTFHAGEIVYKRP